MFRLILSLALALLLLGAGFTSAQDGLIEERLLLTFVPNVQFSPFYVGIEGGYFADAGFEITLEHLQEPEVLDLVALERANFGIVSGEQVILARAQGRDVIYVFEWFQQYPVGLVFDSVLDFADLQNLRGKTVGLPGRFGASYSGLTTLLRSAGLSEADIELQEIGFNAPQVFCLGAVDAAVVYVNNEPLQIRQRAAAGECGEVADVAVLSVAAQVDLVSNGLIVNRALLEQAPAQIESLVGALTGALSAVINNPAAAYLLSLPHIENLPASPDLMAELQAAAAEQVEFLATKPDRVAIAASRQALGEALAMKFDAAELTQFQVLLHTIELWDAEQLGFSDLASWQAMRDTLEAMGFLAAESGDLQEAFSNRFVAGSDA